MYYFAYGSNMCPARIARRTPSAKFVGVSGLYAHEMRWNKRSKDGSAKCDAALTGNAADYVLGVIYQVHEGEERQLDRAEGVGSGYRKTSRLFRVGSSDVVASYYQATASAIDDGLLPYAWYKDHVMCGALDHRLPQDYIAKLAHVPAQEDPDSQRHTREIETRNGPLGGHARDA